MTTEAEPASDLAVIGEGAAGITAAQQVMGRIQHPKRSQSGSRVGKDT
jgi:predicted NAD/FAD-binding protein